MPSTSMKQPTFKKYFTHVIKAINEIMRCAYSNNGQTYDSIKRLYVKEEVFEKTVEGLKERILKIKLGDPTD